MERYKKRTLNFSKDSDNVNLRAIKRNIERRNSRHTRLSAIRNLDSVTENSFIEPSVFEKELSCESTVNPELVQKEPSRLDMLRKWKKERDLKKLLERKKALPFVTSKVVLKNAPVPPSKNEDTFRSTVIKKPQMPPPRTIPKQQLQRKACLPAKNVAEKSLSVKTTASNQNSTSRIQRPVSQSAFSQIPKCQPNKIKTLPLNEKTLSKEAKFVRPTQHTGLKSAFTNRGIPKNIANKETGIASARQTVAVCKPSALPKSKAASSVRGISKAVDPPVAKKLESRPSFAASDFTFTVPFNVRNIVFSTLTFGNKKSMEFTPKNFSFSNTKTPKMGSVQRLKSSSAKKANKPTESAMQTPSILRKPIKKQTPLVENKEKTACSPFISVDDNGVSGCEPETIETVVAPLENTLEKEEIFAEKPPAEIDLDIINNSLAASPAPNPNVVFEEDPAVDLKSILSMCPPKQERLSRRLSIFPSGDKFRLNSISEATEADVDLPHANIMKSLVSPGSLTPRRSRRLASLHMRIDSLAKDTDSSVFFEDTPKTEPVEQFSEINVATPEHIAKSGKKKSKKSLFNQENLLSFSPDDNMTPKRRSSRLAANCNASPLQVINNIDLGNNKTYIESPMKTTHKLRKISLLGSPVQRKTRSSSIKGDLMSFSPNA